jgi:hypothetical protein
LSSGAHVDRSYAVQGEQADRVVRVLRTLYLLRIFFAVAWVSLVSASATAGDGRVGLLIDVLLIVYTASDAIASGNRRVTAAAGPSGLVDAAG